jgi:predicted nucleic acid-binding protein
MPRLILDTSVLIRHWHNSRAGRPLEQIAEDEVPSWARLLIDLENTNATLTPILIEFLCGIGDRTEMRLARIYLEPFAAIDKGKVLVSDWKEARRMAERVPPNRRPRGLGDCLIRAIANRLKYDVRTFDTGMPR